MSTNGTNGQYGEKIPKVLKVAGLAVETVYHAGVPVLTLTGEADMSTAWTARDALAGAREDARRAGVPLALDLRGVTFIDSSGVALLLSAHRRERDDGGGRLTVLLLAHAQPLRVVRLLLFDRVFRVLTLEATASGEAVAAAIRGTAESATPDESGRE